jgi:CRISPR-associated protein Cas5d
LAKDRIDGKHFGIAKRSLDLGGRQDIFLGTRDCQGYVEPCEFGSGAGDYDVKGELGFGLMFHSFDYPDETGINRLAVIFWRPQVVDGVIRFPRPEDCPVKNTVREMEPKSFGLDKNLRNAASESEGLGI